MHVPLQTITNIEGVSDVAHGIIHISDPHVERKLGDTEASYFLPSRENGVNDMYLHLGCHVPERFVERHRVSVVWAIMRLRHPLLASKVIMYDYEDIRFAYDVPISPAKALSEAERNLEYRTQSKADLIDSYLNGPRTLSNERLSYLVVAHDSSPSENGQDSVRNYDFLFCATHFLGDGMALHQFANDFFGLLGGPSDQAALMVRLAAEWSIRCTSSIGKPPTLPSSMEDRLPPAPISRFRDAVSRVDFDLEQRKFIGGHTFPRRSKLPLNTIVPTISLDREKTKVILRSCKTRGVSISSALFAICNIAWARTHSQGWELPLMMYSALNMRPNLMADKRLNDSYWFLAIGYFNVVLPTFIPQSSDVSRTFWHRARSAKNQSIKAAKSTMVISRCREMARERGARARTWAKEDDDALAGIPKKPVAAPVELLKTVAKSQAPSKALMGLSLLGNLDGIYKHSTFPDIQLLSLNTGSRQRAGGMLLFGYTFVEKLWVSFGYDANGFEEGTVQQFWINVVQAIDEFLLS
ncbi:hypothetical protein B0H34DRAFT_645497 [Crassisporium funariophilum]|nr:hypothetical protein B0H34DRAFT_645497 [Crassisporium funariophilum]